MKWGVVIIVLLICLGFVVWFYYQNMPGNPQSFNQTSKQTPSHIISYGPTPVFYPNMRFETGNISYYIDSACSADKKTRIADSFLILEQDVGEINFFQADQNNAEILITCSRQEIQEGDILVAGEGGPIKIINTSLFNVIFGGKVLLYKASECKEPIVELHELLHVFGFDHSKNPNNIMYNFSSCDQKISADIIQTLKDLYAIPSLPDLYFSNITAVKKGKYLDFNLEIRNRGLADSGNFTISLMADKSDAGDFNFENIGVGEGRVLYAENFKLPSRDVSNITFVINNVDSLNSDDNVLNMYVQN